MSIQRYRSQRNLFRYGPYVRAGGRALFNFASRAARRYLHSRNRQYETPRGPRPMSRPVLRSRSLRYRRPHRPKGYYTKCKIKKLCKFMKQQQAVHVHRRRAKQTITANAGSSNTGNNATGGSISEHALAVTNLRYFDPVSNTLVVRDANVDTYSRDISMSIVRTCTVRNNYHIPCNVKIYSCVPKTDTDETPLDLFNSGLADQAAPSNISSMIKFRDSTQLKSIYKIKTLFSGNLEAGKQRVVRSFQKKFEFSPSLSDIQLLEYQAKVGGHFFVVRIEGAVAHDSIVTTEIGLAPAAVDVFYDAEYTICYDAGKDLHDITITDGSTSTFTNVAKVSHKPLAAQQNFLRA